jgi:hypothetical protein
MNVRPCPPPENGGGASFDLQCLEFLMTTHRPVDIPRDLADWINGRLPGEALWEVRPVELRDPPHRPVAYDVIVTGDRPPQAARAPDLKTACRRAVLRYLRHPAEQARETSRQEDRHAPRHRS